jgi:hypothetical protein
MVARRKYEKPAKGISLRQDGTMRRIVITFDDETFDQVLSMATQKQISFAEAVRQLVEHGLHDEYPQRN